LFAGGKLLLAQGERTVDRRLPARIVDLDREAERPGCAVALGGARRGLDVPPLGPGDFKIDLLGIREVEQDRRASLRRRGRERLRLRSERPARGERRLVAEGFFFLL